MLLLGYVLAKAACLGLKGHLIDRAESRYSMSGYANLGLRDRGTCLESFPDAYPHRSARLPPGGGKEGHDMSCEVQYR